MMFTTHIALALLLFFLIAYTHLIQPYTMVLIIVVIGSLLPDIDHTKSYISQSSEFAQFLSGTLTKELITHRGITHTIYASICSTVLAIIVWYALNIGGINPLLAGFGMFLGYIAHLLGDSITTSGIYWLGRNNEKYHYMKRGFIPTGSRAETILQYLLLFAVAILFIKVGLV